MKKINVSEATNNQLDWLVAQCEGVLDEDIYPRHSYSCNPAQMWPIIERVKISTDWDHDVWNASAYGQSFYTSGPTALIAAARCYVVSKLGQTVEVPEELT